MTTNVICGGWDERLFVSYSRRNNRDEQPTHRRHGVRWTAGLGVAMQPFEVSYTMTGRNGKKVRNVIGVLCPTVIAQRMGLARPIFVSLGDIEVDWNAPQSDGYVAMFDTPNADVTGLAPGKDE